MEVERGRLTFEDMLKAIFGIILAAMGLAQAQTDFPEVAKGSIAVARVFAGVLLVVLCATPPIFGVPKTCIYMAFLRSV